MINVKTNKVYIENYSTLNRNTKRNTVKPHKYGHQEGGGGGGLINGLRVFNRVEFRENVKAPMMAWN